jgi:hypothetical protein
MKIQVVVFRVVTPYSDVGYNVSNFLTGADGQTHVAC